MKNDNSHFSTAYSMIKKTIFLSILFSIVLLVSCDKDSDIETDGIEKTISTDSIYFSCTINNEFFEFKSPSAELYSTGKCNSRLCVLKDNPKDSSILEYSREFYDHNYFIEFRFNNVYLVDTLSFLNTPNVKGDLFVNGDYPFQLLSLDDYSIGEPTTRYIGVCIKIFDVQNHKIYTSSISYSHRENLNEQNDFMENSLFQITNSFSLDSNSNSNDFTGLELSNNWFIEANFKCKLYEFGNRYESNYIENAIYISDGVLKGCF